jgi:hypothetical protein
MPLTGPEKKGREKLEAKLKLETENREIRNKGITQDPFITCHTTQTCHKRNEP